MIKKILNKLKFIRQQRKMNKGFIRSYDLNKKNMIDFLSIEITNICNSKCIFCVHGLGGMKRKKEFMSNEKFRKIVDVCKKENIVNLSFGGHGEFLMDPHFFDKVKYIKDSGLNFTSLTTNGMLLTEDVINKLFELKIPSVTISIDSTDETIYEKTRIGLKFSQVMDNLMNLLLINKKHNNIMKINLNVTMYDENKDEYQKFHEKFKSFLNDNFTISFIPLHNMGTLNNIVHSKVDYNLRQPCGMLFNENAILIRSDGHLSACCCADFDNTYSLGEVKDSIYDLWNGEKITEMRKKHVQGKWNDISICKNCNYNYIEREYMVIDKDTVSI